MAAAESVDVVVISSEGPHLSWGWVLASGLVWIGIALLILTAHPVAITTIAFIVGFVVVLAGIAELINMALSPGWKWLHLAIGGGLVVLGILAFFNTFETFVGLSILLGWYLVLKGITTMIAAIAFRSPGSLWGVLLAAGIAYLAIGVWALGYPGRSTWLLVLWLGLGALMHGVVDLIRAFELRSAEHSPGASSGAGVVLEVQPA